MVLGIGTFLFLCFCALWFVFNAYHCFKLLCNLNFFLSFSICVFVLCSLCLVPTIASSCFAFWNFFFHFWFVLYDMCSLLIFASSCFALWSSLFLFSFFVHGALWCVDSGAWMMALCGAWHCGFGRWNFCVFMLCDFRLVLTFALNYFVL